MVMLVHCPRCDRVTKWFHDGDGGFECGTCHFYGAGPLVKESDDDEEPPHGA